MSFNPFNRDLAGLPPAYRERLQTARDAIGGALALRLLEQRLAEEQRAARYRPGDTLDALAWRAGRLAVLEELLRDARGEVPNSTLSAETL